MRAGRLLSILIHLQARGRATARDLAQEFHVTLRTIYRDIDELSASGVPVVAERGPGGGYRLIDGYQTRLTGLTASEAETLLLAGLPGPAADLGLGDALGAARAKLLASLSPEASDNASRIGSRFHLDVGDWFRKLTPPECLGDVAQAVWRQRRLAIRYESWTATRERVVDPLGLVLKAGAWYLIARSGEDTRTFKVARMQSLVTLDDGFDYPRGFNLAQYWQASLQQFQGALKPQVATLRVAECAMAHVDHLGADAAARIRAAEAQPDGWRVCEVPIERNEVAAWLLIGFADSIEVLSPPALRETVVGIAERVVSLYRNDPVSSDFG